jgi:hypothetical protein
VRDAKYLGNIWEFEIPEYRFTGGVIEIVIWEMRIDGTTWALCKQISTGPVSSTVGDFP